MIENGEIVEIGAYDELKTKSGSFSNFIKNYLQEMKPSNNEASEDSDTNKKKTKPSLDIETNDSETEEDTKKSGEKLILKEKIETGCVKTEILIEYFKMIEF